MPHFYRYRSEDDDIQTHSRTPARSTTISSSKTEEAHVRCLGVAGEICIPSGDEKNKVNINSLFYEIDKTIRSLKEENEQLRAEVDYLKDICKNKVATSPPPVPAVVQNAADSGVEDRLRSQIQSLDSKLGSCQADVNSVKNLNQSSIQQIQSMLEALQTEHSQHKQEVDNALSALANMTLATTEKKEEDEAVAIPKPDITPFAVVFDAVRCEDWMGQDSFLPFTKLNTNLGGGMNMDTGKFTAPVTGLYFLALNVYGAPRDGVVLSIKLNDYFELASCSGVGKASQSCIVELDENDTVGVYINEKSKITDTNNNRFTHFLGFLMRSKM
jgi:hypothetical protein